MSTIFKTLELVTESCINCGIIFAMPKDFMDECQSDVTKKFYCPNGHVMVYRFSTKDQEIQRLKKQNEEAERARESLHNQLSDKSQEINSLQKSIKRRNKRIAAGVCPCCNRTVSQLAEHMKTMHPEIAKAPTVAAIHKKISSK